MLAAVFADDVGAAHDAGFERKCLAIWLEHSKLMSIDSPGPDTTVPITMFVGCQWGRDRGRGTVKSTQVQHICKLAKRFGGCKSVPPATLPTCTG